MRREIPAGTRFGRLTVVSEAEKGKWGHRRFNVLCECGTPRVALLASLESGTTRSCGCLKREAASQRHAERRAATWGTAEWREATWREVEWRETARNKEMDADAKAVIARAAALRARRVAI